MFSSGRGPLLLPFVAASMIRCSDRRVDYGSLHGATILIFNRDISIKVLKYMSEDLGQLSIITQPGSQNFSIMILFKSRYRSK